MVAATFDALGKGVEEGKLPPEGRTASKYVSRGLTRSRTDRLGVIAGGGEREDVVSDAAASARGPSARDGGAWDRGARTSPSPAGGGSAAEGGRGGVSGKITSLRTGDTIEGAAALKAELNRKLSPTEQL
ncbi:MAG: hypothetical protein R3D52_08710 [Xanthobacteraceae bacterium]